MTRLVLIRHGMTDWNRDKRIQGHVDQPLGAGGRSQLRALELPQRYRDLCWYCSPLRRARETAEILGIDDYQVEPALIEMHWGEWEGEVLKPLRRQLGEVMRANERRGLDFCPPGGESPRQVQARLRPWLARLAHADLAAGAVVHKGIIRCIYALALDWDMRGESPVEFAWDALHCFELDAAGRLLPRYRSVPLSTS